MDTKFNFNVSLILDKWYKFLTFLGVPLFVFGVYLMLHSNEMYKDLWGEWSLNANQVLLKQETLKNERSKINQLMDEYLSTGSKIYFNEQLQILVSTSTTDLEKAIAKKNIEERMRDYKKIEVFYENYPDKVLELEHKDVARVTHDFDANNRIINIYGDAGYFLFVIGISCTVFGLNAWWLAEKKKK